jgi:hypothetical protein
LFLASCYSNRPIVQRVKVSERASGMFGSDIMETT